MSKKNKSIGIVFGIIFSLILTACSTSSTEKIAETEVTQKVAETVVAPSGPVIDYADAESFESALNRGENLEGKIVSFNALELHPQSALGYNVWAGEHLNFVSERNPDIKEGETVTVKTDTIKNNLGSWVITYEKIDNAVIGDTTISSNNQKTESDNPNSAAVTSNESNNNSLNNNISTSKAQDTANASSVSKEDPTFELVDSNIVAFSSYGDPYASAYIAIKNTSDYPIKFSDTHFDYEDNDGKLLAVDSYPNCIPSAIKPGQVGYIYSYYFSLEGIDMSNGLTFKPDGDVLEASNFYEIEVNDINANTNGSGIMDVKIVARGTNNTDKEISLAEPGAIYFDKDDKVVGFCYGIESFDAGQTKSFEISGDMMSRDYDPSMVKRVEVYIQGDSWF